MIPASLFPLPTQKAVADRVGQLQIPFNSFGIDPFGIDRAELAKFMTALGFLYRTYFTVDVFGAQHVPSHGRAMLVGNHSGGVAVDALMVIAAMFYALDSPRLAQGMAEKFIQRLPFVSWFANRVGQFTGLPEHCVRLLEAERLLLVFPEGARGTAKLFRERDSLVKFGTGFVRLALQTRTPIVPFAFVGGGEAIPTVANLYRVARYLGLPYIPVTPYGLPIPLPVSLQILFGPPIILEGQPTDVDSVIEHHVERIKGSITSLLHRGREVREGRKRLEDLDLGG